MADRQPSPALTAGPAVAADAAERLLLLLDDHPVTAIEEVDQGPWRIFFQTAADRDAALAALRQAPPAPGLSFDALEVDDEDWARRSQEGLRAITIGDIVVAPPWDLPPSGVPGAPASLVIAIEPSRGFGTGHHPSTRLALLALQRIDVAGRSVLDAGTGSGVLAIAAARLDARPVVGLDADPDAIETACVSVARNGLAHLVELRVADLREVPGPSVDVVLANLTGPFFSRHGSALLRLLRPGGRLIASGFTLPEEESVRAGLAGATIAERLTEDEWLAFVCST